MFAGSRRAEQLNLYSQHRIVSTVEDSVLRTEMSGLESQEEDVPNRILFFKPMSWLGQIRRHRRDGASGCRKFQLDTMGDHLCTSRGRHCGDIQLEPYLENEAGPVPLVLDLRIDHDRFGSRSDPGLNGHLHYPNDIDKSLNEAAADKIRKYRSDYNHNPPSSVSFMPDVASTSGRLHCEFIRLLFLQVLRETDRFFSTSGVQFAQSTSGLFHFRRVALLDTLKTKVGSTLVKTAGSLLHQGSLLHHTPLRINFSVIFVRRNYSTRNPKHKIYKNNTNLVLDLSISSTRFSLYSSNQGLVWFSVNLCKDVVLRITFNLDGVSITSKSHTHPSHSQTSCLSTSSLSLGVPVTRVTQCMLGV
jgi:hypothetical protein